MLHIICLLVVLGHALSWDPDAGIVSSYTKRPGAKVLANSNQKEADLIIDNKDETHWTSEGCLPQQYINHEGENLLLHACEQGHCTSSSGSTGLSAATDGNWDNAFNARVSGGKAELHIKLPNEVPVRYISVKGSFKGSATLTIDHGNNHKTVKALSSTDNYHKETFAANNVTASSISITSTANFEIDEIGALGQSGCFDRIAVDLGRVETIGSIRVRSWPGEETFESKLLSSIDMKTWHKITNLNPKITSEQLFKVDPPIHARYIAVEHDIHNKDWVKSFVWELDAYGSDGNWGPAPTPKANPNSLKEMFGINGIWGWGTRGPSKNLKAGEGPELYGPLASLGRNYHQVLWDVKKPGNKAHYDQMAQGHGTDGEAWLNWDTEYDLWKKAGMKVDASIQFKADKLPPSSWSNPEQDAYQFGKDFAAHFGPKNGNGLVYAAEVGNEPWDYLHPFYKTILDGMAKGLKDGDSGIKVLPAAFQAHDKGAEKPPWHSNYIGTRVTPDNAQYLDAINGHYYAFVTKPDGTRIMSHPEDPQSKFNGMKNLLRWRDANMPNKAVWITEYGWDCAGGGETCTYSECVSETAASLYGIRALLIMARLGVERAIWFYNANLDKAECDPAAQHIFCRSGLTGSSEVHFAKKKTFDIHKAFLEYVGDKHFLRMVKEDQDAYVYLLGDVQGHSMTATHVVAWRPIDGDDSSSKTVSVHLTAHSKGAKYITPGGLTSAPTISSAGGNMMLPLKSAPLIVEVTPFKVTQGSGIIG